MNSQWLIIADDLTGAADCAIAFGKRGIVAVVAWGEHAKSAATPFPDVQALAVDAASRPLPAAEAAARQSRVLAAHFRPGMRLYKKIDSTLRGQPAAELAALLASPVAQHGGRPRLAILAPAFPGTGRITRDGRVVVQGVPLEDTPLWAREHTYPTANMPEILSAAGLPAEAIALDVVARGPEVIGACLRDARRRGLAAVVCDAQSEADLDAIAQASLSMANEVIWVGSGGLAVALAALDAPTVQPHRINLGQRAHRNVLIVVGTLAEASRQQARAIVEAGVAEHVVISPEVLFAGACTPQWQQQREHLGKLFAAGKDVLLEIEQVNSPELARGGELAERMAEFVFPASASKQSMPIGALLATGGDTAFALLSAMKVNAIRLLDEVEPGVPLGLTQGAVSLPLITKAGAFGDRLTLRRCLERLQKL